MKKENTMWKKLLSLLVALALVLSFVPVITPAAEAADTPSVLYLKPNSNWTQASARFAAYFFGTGEKWVSMTDSNGDGVYEVEVPSGYPSVIFCRMNPSTSANNWSNKWNQTGDLTVPANGNDLCTINDGQWDCGTNVTWSVYTYEEAFYTVAGTISAAGWTPASGEQLRDPDADGVYEYTYTNVAAGSYEFKVTNGTWDSAWPGSNYALTVDKDGSNVTVIFNAVSKTVSTAVVKVYAVTFNGTNVTLSGPESVSEGSDYSAVLTAAEGYALPESITVTGAENYTYDSESGALSIAAADITGDITITAQGVEEENTITVYFRNDWLWSDVRIYYWGSTTGTNPAWAGVAMTLVDNDGTYDIYSAEIPADVTGMLFNGVKNDGSGSRDQSPDITTGIADGNAYYMHWNNGNQCSTFTYTPSGSGSGGGEGGDGGTCTITLHFANTQGWGAVALYSWTGDGTILLGSWPGTAVSQDADGFYTYSYEVESGTAVNFIFNNNGGGSQTGDLSLGTVTSDVEKWIKGEEILDGAFRVVTSPVVEGSSVTFNYEGGSSASVYGSWNGWASAAAMTKDADGVWTLTLTDLEPGVYEYKFVVDGTWISDPANSWTQGSDSNSAFIILDPNAVDENKVTVNIHYTRPDGDYEGWNLWLWNESGNLEDTSELVDGELVATLVFEPARAVQSVSVIPRLSTADSEWADQEDTHTIDLSNIVSGTVDYYITSGTSGGTRVLNTDVVLGNKLTSVELDYETGEIDVTIAQPVTNPQFGITGGDDPDTYTIYFQNNWLWSDVRVYYWGSTTGINPSWPGTAMTLAGSDGTYDIYSAEIPADVTGVLISGVKNDGSGSRDQSPDITSGWCDGLCYYMTWNNGNAVGTFTYDEPISITDVSGSGADYTLTVSEELDLVNLYRYKVIFEGYEYAIGINTVYASDKFDQEYTYEGDGLGADWSQAGTTFKVWVPTAAGVSVRLYATGSDAEDGAEDLGTYPMTKGEKGVWTVTVAGDLNGVYYTYAVTVNGETVEAVDPYARTTGVNGQRGMVIDLDSTDPEGWEDDANPNEIDSYTDAVIYELHVRDFSIDSSSGILEDYQGKFLAFTQTGTTVNGEAGGLSTGIDYLKSLGVTHVHLLPVYDYGSVDETKCENFNWGYDPVNYNVPEGSYSTDPYKGEVRVEEMKEMILALHEAGISVIMDVVYNHVYDAGEFCFNQIVPGYFSRVSSNSSGCGNDTASEREMVSKYIVESVAYWCEEYHIDGFRFDLVGLIDVGTINKIVDTVHNGLNRPDVIFYGEGWNMDGTNSEEGTEMAKQGNADKTPGFAYFSDSIRNQIAGSNGSSLGYVSGGGLGNLIAYYLAQPESWGETWTYDPTQVVQYASCHDNYTLIDKLVISTDAIGVTDEIIRMNNLAAAIYMTAQGIPFIHAGEEMLREKLEEDGDRCENSYNASDYVNSIKWDNLLEEEYADTLAYYQGLIAFRKAHAALRVSSAEDVAENILAVRISDSVIAFLYDGTEFGDDDILVLFNAGESTVVDLPEGVWNVCVDHEDAGTDTLYTAQTSVQVCGISAMILTRADTGKNEDQTAGASSSGITLYFSNNKYWGSVYAHYWGGSEASSWPGAAMTWVETNGYGEDIYSITIPADSTGILFHNNSGTQTVDLVPGADGTGYYLSDDSGNCGTYEYASSGGSAGGAGFTNDGIYEGDSQYYLFGWINGENYACDGCYEAMGKYQFVEGKLTVKFELDSYVGVKTTGNTAWYMTDGWLGSVTSATLYNSDGLGTGADKLMIPGGVEVTLTLTENSDGTLTLSYAADGSKAVTDTSGIQNGVTLQCWNWSFRQIEANMALIAEMGFTAIQTSPIQPLKEATTDPTDTVEGCWWLYYQPVGFTITDDEGNVLGTREDLVSMIETAHEYGIQVIVDVVANHLGNQSGNDLSSSIPGSLLEQDFWHDYAINISNYSDRYDVTQHAMGGLPDLNTANAALQQIVLDFLTECVDIGVDGFRFDAAKHIETPDDELPYDSDFWPVVIGGAEQYARDTYGKDLYVYGEVLDGMQGIPVASYTQYMAVTDNSWGNTLRQNLAAGIAAISKGYDKATGAATLVVWAESHDTYATDDASQSSAGVSEDVINMTWALVAARADAMGLYLARPASNSQLLGVASVTGWYSDVVRSANEFHSAFVGQGESVGSSGDIAFVLRGTSGIVLVNAKGTGADVELSVAMADGTYIDQITGSAFTVSGGKLSGAIGSTGVAVVYNAGKTVTVTGTEGGSVAVSDETPLTGDTVTITVTPDTGKEIASVTVTDAKGTAVAVTDNGDGTYSFVQSIEDVTVTVTFADIEYQVTVTQPEGGEVAVDKDAPIYGDTVTITVTPDTGKEIASVTVTDAKGNAVAVTDNGDGTYSFVQSIEDVTVSATLSDIEYQVSITQPEGGEVAVDKDAPTYGETVTITVTPGEGKAVDTVTVTANGETLAVTKNADGTYSYTHPAGDVTITVTFKDVQNTRPDVPDTGISGFTGWTVCLALASVAMLFVLTLKGKKEDQE